MNFIWMDFIWIHFCGSRATLGDLFHRRSSSQARNEHMTERATRSVAVAGWCLLRTSTMDVPWMDMPSFFLRSTCQKISPQLETVCPRQCLGYFEEHETFVKDRFTLRKIPVEPGRKSRQVGTEKEHTFQRHTTRC